MMQPTSSYHLVERAAARLRETADASMVRLAAFSDVSVVEDRLAPSTLNPTPEAMPLADAERETIAPATPPARISVADLIRAGLVRDDTARSRMSEEARVTAGWLLRNLRTAKPGLGIPNVMMVTSTSPGEGKSFTALNLGASLATSSMAKVILVDIDPKLESLSTRLGLAEQLGLLDLAANPQLRPEALLVHTDIEGFAILPLGKCNAPAVDRGVTHMVSLAVERVARTLAHSIVILDTPPCLSTSDPSALAPLVAQIAVVVEAEKTQRSEVETALELLRACPNVVLVLNKVRASQHAFGAYDYFSS